MLPVAETMIQRILYILGGAIILFLTFGFLDEMNGIDGADTYTAVLLGIYSAFLFFYKATPKSKPGGEKMLGILVVAFLAMETFDKLGWIAAIDHITVSVDKY